MTSHKSPHAYSSQDADDAPSVGLLITMHLDWTSTFRVTEVASAHMWATIQSLVHTPGRDDQVAQIRFERIKKFVKDYMLDKVVKIPVCPCGETIYYDFQSAKLRKLYPYCESRRTQCTLCGETKCVPKSKTPRKTVYFISPEYWLRDLYQRKDMARVLANDVNPEDTPVGSIHRSEGYKTKVTDNDVMNEDSRNAALVGYADGGPFYKDKNAGSGWFFMLRHTGLPPELLLEPSLAHMPLFIGNHHYHTDAQGATTRRKRYVTNPSIAIMAILFVHFYIMAYHMHFMVIIHTHQGAEGSAVCDGGAGRRPPVFV
jgi:hypothetical protein